MNSQDRTVIVNFLKSCLSTRELDKLLGFTDSRGWVSWNILKKNGFTSNDKGKLFLYTEKQAVLLIQNFLTGKKSFNKIVAESPPNNLEKYRDTSVLARNDKTCYNIFSGETRNIIKDFFGPLKRITGKCQYMGCKSKTELDTVHFNKDRPYLFVKSASMNKKRVGNNLYKYDVYATMKQFLLFHSKPKSVCFLCKLHHNQLHRCEKDKKELNIFRRKIKFN